MTRFRATRDEAGFSLVEVVVAVLLLALVTTAVLPFFLQGITKSSGLQQRQAAVAVANSAMEGARAVVATQQNLGSPTSPALVTGLVRGREQSAVTAQWSGLPPVVTAATTPRWDPDPASAPPNPSADPPTQQVIPLQRTDTVSGVEYTSDVLIGTCWRLRADPSADCSASGPGAVPTGSIEMVRLVVITRWTSLEDRGTASDCGAAGCSYRLVSLVDPTKDPTWPTGAGEVVDDPGTIEIPIGSDSASKDFPVLLNDLVTYTAANPVVIDTASLPLGVSATTLPNGVVRVTVTRDSPTPALVRYRVKNSSGGLTERAIINVEIVKLVPTPVGPPPGGPVAP